MKFPVVIATLLATVTSADFCMAADPRYPDWPCAQAKVPEISLAAVWAGPPLDDIKDKWKDDAKVNALVSKLSARKLPLDEAQKAITEYLTAAAADRARAHASCLPDSGSASNTAFQVVSNQPALTLGRKLFGT